MSKTFYSISQVEQYFWPKSYAERKREELIEKGDFSALGAFEMSEILNKLDNLGNGGK